MLEIEIGDMGDINTLFELRFTSSCKCECKDMKER